MLKKLGTVLGYDEDEDIDEDFDEDFEEPLDDDNLEDEDDG